MKKTIIGGSVIVISLFCYFLFEPVFVWAFGWKTLPEDRLEQSNLGIEDEEFTEAITKSQQLLSKSHVALQAPAISIAVGMSNKIVWSEASGFSDLENKIAANANTKFRIGSVSKAVTSSGLGKLLENERLRLDDPVGKYLSYFKSPEITVLQLASHTSGIRNYGLCFCFPIWEYYSDDSHQSIEESVEVFNGDPLLFNPGSGFSYSTYNYTLLSAVIEKASEKNFLDFMAEEVFLPVGMSQTSGDYADSLMADRAKLYDIDDGRYKEVFPVENSNKWAGGGLISTPSDLVKLGNALLHNTLLKEETVDTLFSVQKLPDGTANPQNYALGWRNDTFEIFNGKQSVQVVHHGGTALGATALLILLPEYELSLAIVMNKSSESFQLFDHALPIAEQFIAQLEK